MTMEQSGVYVAGGYMLFHDSVLCLKNIWGSAELSKDMSALWKMLSINEAKRKLRAESVTIIFHKPEFIEAQRTQ